MITPQMQDAINAQAQANAAARAETSLDPQPPTGYPALAEMQSAEPFGSATPLGYREHTESITEHRHHGRLKRPGDQGFYEMITALLCGRREPAGWTHQQRPARMLYVCCSGNACLLAQAARESGYPDARVTAPSWVRLIELPAQAAEVSHA